MPNLNENNFLLIHDKRRHAEVVRRIDEVYYRPGIKTEYTEQELTAEGFRFEKLNVEYSFKKSRAERYTELNNMPWIEIMNLVDSYNINISTPINVLIKIILDRECCF